MPIYLPSDAWHLFILLLPVFSLSSPPPTSLLSLCLGDDACAKWPILPCPIDQSAASIAACDQSEACIGHPRIVTRHYIIDPGWPWTLDSLTITITRSPDKYGAQCQHQKWAGLHYYAHISHAHWIPDFDTPTYISLLLQFLIQLWASFVCPSSILILTPLTRVQLVAGHDHDALLTAGDMSDLWLIIWSPFVCPVCPHSLCSLLCVSKWPKLSLSPTLKLYPALRGSADLCFLCLDVRMLFCKRFDPTFTVTLLDTWQRCPGCALCQ